MTLPLPALKAPGKANLDALLEAKIAEQTVPCIFWAATNVKETIYENQAGYNVMGDPTSGTVHRDSISRPPASGAWHPRPRRSRPKYQHLPELAELPVLDGYDEHDCPTLVPQRSRITLKMLMNHTSGAVHAAGMPPPALQKYWDAMPVHPAGLYTSEGSIKGLLFPLVFQPGTAYSYSCGTDWIGILITRVTGLSFEEYLQQNVFSRVEGGMPDTTFYPRKDIMDRKVGIYERQEDGSLKHYRISKNRADSVETVSKTFLAGAGGLFGSTKDYLALCRAVLQCDPRNPSPPNQPLLKPGTYKLIFEPSLDQAQAKEFSGNMKDWKYLLLDPDSHNVNHSVAMCCVLEDTVGGRKAGSGGWSGMAHTHFWLDPATGVAIIGPNPDPWHKVLNAFERELYENIH